jgi:hypothetical protein
MIGIGLLFSAIFFALLGALMGPVTASVHE